MPEQAADTDTDELLRALRASDNNKTLNDADLLKDFCEIVSRCLFPMAPTADVAPPAGVPQAGSGVEVATKEGVMGIFLDPQNNYSVEGSDDPSRPIEGYRQRARASFGEIYLCLNKGAEYDRQAQKVNEAIQRITEPEAFKRALAETRKVLAADPEAAANPAAHIETINTKVLAALCTHWFDLPDGTNAIEGGKPMPHEPPAMCPADFGVASAYIFNPVPAAGVEGLAKLLGRVLKRSVLKYVTDLRAAGRAPTGVLSAAIFDNFPDGEEDLVAQTVIGVMVGMLPTLDHNIRNIAADWAANGQFPKLAEALRLNTGTDAYQRARAVLEEPLMQAIQRAPVPPAVWRTAIKAHTIEATTPVQVQPGEKILVNIASAMAEDLKAGVTDVFPVFGGNRNASPHPTHACPGYAAAMGIMLGLMNGLLEPR